ncbi:MAG: cysteine--tRNA ligase [Candidatus Yanofskybacteria bacterium RIFCSPLOWO2_12_FULL_43_11b]|uniref:Cysteine--tRNA ligase n=1 Tax=Candidatus Yanofskybacteria bacterium RIFCSPLOWO2_12_FULL_43_11b TaxID=1802710 RepID=A0A1F8H8L5_9BACT|nr:MAG: cysteine--tRNA ligase [Candidatus Yanofskybacteria bacterium RIFCSPHIGHO2_01_FULL_43_32]OGN11996.1 MAG: cysteine--tRNA ligase [Candidatus Yanofskybacteria bacterium RIFCSPHIGHO2_02_FULL_43_12]OGN17824.1 MAG: cysteine--tRNA ligase [Candidatus Yanofskybacteria bacterium RIFCSPHIGHO2_12_FULL_43_11]OGN24782.1 MAG: cysteine--tRNA ligase [Candidatus Yanofskybacteria bacterium RIFCSPLOWO2_01_FULL_43_46]OGN33219.1 MAG: cysteine--tRNA ligase [Candidatus Yanofskybacteria bacterium RIFCSPLOWO2_12_
MKIFNTLTKQLEPLPSPDEQKKLNMFVCGPTVYDYIHIGNARTFVMFDVVAKYLRYRGYDVNYIQNITDIDNKIIERAQKENTDPLEYAKKYSDFFKQDMLALGVTSPEYKNAVDHIPEVIKQVRTLLDKGNAYVIENDGIYFDLSTFPDYGKLSGRTASMADDAVSRIDDSDRKRNRGDFALWKFGRPGDPSWPAPFGAGRPGWHIEDTAITEKYFGPQYDIHGGGQDLIFPHHEAEIAQQESASGLKPFVKYWMHSGFLINKESKMSKSLGNFTTLHEALKKYGPKNLRLYLLSAHYRSPLALDENGLTSAIVSNAGVYAFEERLELVRKSKKTSDDGANKIIDEAVQGFEDSLDNDFNTPKALASFFTSINKFFMLFNKGGLGLNDVLKIEEYLKTVNNILGIINQPKIKIPEEIVKKVEEREVVRKNKEWVKSDELRQEIENLGFDIDDTPYGPLVSEK